MRSITDRDGTRWEVGETGGRHAVGTIGGRQRLPEPIDAIVVFKSAGGRRVSIKTSAGAADNMTNAKLLELLEKALVDEKKGQIDGSAL